MLTIGAISNEFEQEDPNMQSYVNNLHEEVIFGDMDFEMERDHLQKKDQEKSFIDFYSSRKQLKNSEIAQNSSISQMNRSLSGIN